MSPVAINGVDKQGVYVNGVQVKQALDPTNETVNKGVYDPTTLSAVDADLAPANIKDGVTIFGKLGTFAGITFSDYHYYEDMAVGSTYTPPSQSQALLMNEALVLGTSLYRVEFHDGVGWVAGHTATPYESFCCVFQDNGQNLRVYNNCAAQQKFSLTGVIWSSGISDYHYYENLGAGASYTPPAKAISTMFNSHGDIESDFIRLEFYDGAAWFHSSPTTPMNASALIQQDNAQNVRVYNNDASAHKISLTGVTW